MLNLLNFESFYKVQEVKGPQLLTVGPSGLLDFVFCALWVLTTTPDPMTTDGDPTAMESMTMDPTTMKQ